MDWLKGLGSTLSNALGSLNIFNASTPTGPKYFPPPGGGSSQLGSISTAFPQSLPSIPQTPALKTGPFVESLPPNYQAPQYSTPLPGFEGGMSLVGGGVAGPSTPIPSSFRPAVTAPIYGPFPVPGQAGAGGTPAPAPAYPQPGQIAGGGGGVQQPFVNPIAAAINLSPAPTSGAGVFSGGGVSGGASGGGTSTPAGGGGGGIYSPGGASYASATGELTEEQKRAQAPKPFVPMINPFSIPAGFVATSTPGGGTAYRSPEGALYIPTQGGLQLAPEFLPGAQPVNEAGGQTYYGAVAPQVRVQNFSAGTAPSSVDISAAQKQSAEAAVQNFLKSGGTQADFQNFYNAELQKRTDQMKAENPLPDQPVNPTQEQLALEQSGGVSIKAQMDTVRTQLGLPQLEKTRVDLMQKLQAGNQLFQDIIDSIKNILDLPVSLAQRRIEQFTKDNARTLKNFEGQLGIVTQQIEDANDQLNTQFNIQKFQAEQAKPFAVGAESYQLNETTGKYEKIGGQSLAENQATDTFYDFSRNYPEVAVQYNPNLSPSQNLEAMRQAVSSSPKYQTEVQRTGRDPLLEQLRMIKIMEQTSVSTGQLTNASTGLPAKGGQELQTRAIELKGLLQMAGYVEGRINSGVQTGAVRGWVTYQGLKIPAIQETLDPNVVQLQTELLGLFTRYVYAMTGKQVNEREFENASRSTPTVQGTPQNNLATLKEIGR